MEFSTRTIHAAQPSEPGTGALVAPIFQTATYEQDAHHTYLEFMDRLAAVDLLHIDDMAVARQTEWVLEQLYTVINRRYEDQRSIVFTTDHSDLGACVGNRTFSRLREMCGDPLLLEGEDARVTF